MDEGAGAIVIVARARACIGARFRPHGRNPRFGLDCVGLAGRAFAREGLAGDYALRGGSVDAVIARIEAAGLVPGRGGAGDLALLDLGSGQLHLAVLVPGGFVHADARLRRVVETPGAPPGRPIGTWGEKG